MRAYLKPLAVISAKTLWLTISVSGTDDVVARYTCFLFPLFAKQLIPTSGILLLFYCLAGFIKTSLLDSTQG
jgi:hypothetical protein